MANQRNSLLVLSKLRKSDQLTSAFHLHTSHPAMVDLKLQKPVCINLAPTPTPSPLTRLKLKAGQNLWKADQQLGRPQPPREPASGKLVLASEGLRHWQLEPSWSPLADDRGRDLETQQLVVPASLAIKASQSLKPPNILLSPTSSTIYFRECFFQATSEGQCTFGIS